MNSATKGRRIVIVGDLVIDHNYYAGERPAPGMLDRRGLRVVRRYGGAAGLLATLAELNQRLPEKKAEDAENAAILDTAKVVAEAGPARLEFWVDDHSEKSASHAFAIWRPHPRRAGIKDEDKRLVWRAELLGYGDSDDLGPPPRLHAENWVELPEAAGPQTGSEPLAVLVIDDAGQGFRKTLHTRLWDACLAEKPDWILLKMSNRVARGDLWHRLAEEHGKRLVCLVSADDLRREQAPISRGLSWERTLNDLRLAIRRNPAFATLRRSRHLVIVLANDAALWIDDDKVATFLFDPGGIEGGWDDGREGKATGYMTAMAAAITHHVATLQGQATGGALDLAPAIRAGFRAMRRLSEQGHGAVKPDPTQGATTPTPPSGYPQAMIAEAILDGTDVKFAALKVAWTTDDARDEGMLVEASQLPVGAGGRASVHGLARMIVTRGHKQVLSRYPHAVFGKLTVVDRHEIEALRSIRTLMRTYRADRAASKPVCIGVFGPPGAGKSFGVKQLAQEMFGERAWLEFNVSQFSDASDLTGPFHQIRDRVLAGVTPVAFWDEFDAKENAWLQWLLAPMQDGRFQDGELTHDIGKAVFIFAGGTCESFATFSLRKDGEDLEKFKLRKGPDFVSRLDAFYDVVGPNPRRLRKPDPQGNPTDVVDPDDVSFPLRRAILLRHVFAKDADARVDIDSDLLDALLLTSRYKHGSRSLEKLAATLAATDHGPILRSALPPPERLRMLVDDADFFHILNRNAGFRSLSSIDVHAAAIHQRYLDHMKTTPDEVAPEMNRPYAQLTPSQKEGNRAAFRRTVDVLAQIGLGVAPKGCKRALTRDDFDALLTHHKERLCEAEHDGWVAQRLADDWRFNASGGRDFEKQLHSALGPYDALPEKDKAKDRLMVEGFWDRVTNADFEIVPLLDPESHPT